MQIFIQPKTVLTVLFCCIGLLLLAQLGGMVLWHGFGYDYAMGFVPMFRMDGERSFPTLFSTLQLFVAAASLAAIGYGVTKHRYYWYCLAAVFLFLSADEYIGFHELLAVTRGRLDPSLTLQFAWLVPYLIGTLLLGLAFVPFLLALPRRTMLLFCGSGAVFVGAAIGLEAVTGLIDEAGYGVQALPQRLVATVEEVLEMGSISVFIYAQLDYVRETRLSLALRWPVGSP